MWNARLANVQNGSGRAPAVTAPPATAGLNRLTEAAVSGTVDRDEEAQ